MRQRNNLCLFKQTPIPAKVTLYILSQAFVSCLGCQHFTSDWLGKLKPNKLSTGSQNELKGVAIEKATNLGRRFLFFSRLCGSFWHTLHANFAARQNCHAMQANYSENQLIQTLRDMSWCLYYLGVQEINDLLMLKLKLRWHKSVMAISILLTTISIYSQQ